jgi:hypothetical protein
LVAGGIAIVLVLSAGCGSGPPDTGSTMTPSASDPVPQRTVQISDGGLVLNVGETSRTLHTLGEEDGTPVHATLRPGDHDEDTVVVLTRVDDEFGDRYELRYLVATDDSVSELFWFPYRLQVAEEVPAILDVAPVPVWSPDGSAIAWIEWVDEGTRLRTVGWIDDGETRNPSDDASAYALDDVPPGVQLETWKVDPGGDPVLLGRRHNQPYRIQLALGDSGPSSDW